MDNDRVPCRPALGHKDPLHNGGIERIRAEPIDGFSWQRHKPAGTKDGGGAVQCCASLGSIKAGGIDRQTQCLHSYIFTAGAGPAARLPIT